MNSETLFLITMLFITIVLIIMNLKKYFQIADSDGRNLSTPNQIGAIIILALLIILSVFAIKFWGEVAITVTLDN